MTAKIYHADLWGTREHKNAWLDEHSIASTEWESVDPAEPFYLFKPFDKSEVGDYYDWPAINEVMPVNVTGIVTARDGFVIDFDEDALLDRIADLRDDSLSDQAIRERYFAGKGSKKYPPGDSRGWKLPTARAKTRADTLWRNHVAPMLYRPFDTRVIYYTPWMVDWPRTEAMPHMLAGENVGLTICRQSIGDSWQHAFATRRLTDDSMVSNRSRERGYVCPLYLYPGVGKVGDEMFDEWPEGEDGRRPNLDPGFVRGTESATGLSFVSDGRGDLEQAFGPEDLLAYIYAVFHWPEYRRRYEPMLKLDFPRVPPPRSRDGFVAFAELGHDLLAAHLLEDPSIDGETVGFPVAGDGAVAKGYPKYVPPGAEVVKAGKDKLAPDAERGRVYINKNQYFEGVEPAVWRFQIGGYQVCEKWLKDRRGRTLDYDDLTHYGKLVESLRKTIDLMARIEAGAAPVNAEA